jgi:hypothetical protein
MLCPGVLAYLHPDFRQLLHDILLTLKVLEVVIQLKVRQDA